MTRVYVSAIGQEDNIGDSILRRAYLDALRGLGELHVLIGGSSPGYVAGLGLTTSDVIYTQRKDWWLNSTRSVLRHKTFIAYNAGEMQGSRKFVVSYVRHAAISVAARLRGGGGLHVGMGMRARTRLSPVIGLLLVPAKVVRWRDTESRAWTHRGGVAPDWAFLTGSKADRQGHRPILAVSLRGDRPDPPREWGEAVDEIARALGLETTVVVQVRRDNDLANRLGESYGWKVSNWIGEDHLAREAEVRDLYRSTAVVISDRLHALVLGATEGAVPLGFSPNGIHKIGRTLAAAGYARNVLDARRTPSSLVDASVAIARDKAASARSLEVARGELERLAETIARL